jgi:SWI/SNF-related matrix-associated actin-dependent regulator 1 of chromatin subfamily A
LSWLKYDADHKAKLAATDASDDDNVAANDAPTLPHLIVAPASVVQNWIREFEHFAPHMNVVKYHGSQAEREMLQNELRYHLPGARKPRGTEQLDAIIVPITYFSSESGNDRAFLRKFRFDYLVCDEAHLLKNARGLRYKHLDRFSTSHRLLLTGTPVQNSPKELLGKPLHCINVHM